MISWFAKYLWKVYSWVRRGKTEREKAEAQRDIANVVERGYQQKTKEEKKGVIKEFLELHYPYLLQFVRKESGSVDFINIHIADAARNVYPPAVHGEKRYKKIDSFNKDEEFPSTTLTTLEEVIQWEQLQEDLPVDDFLRRYLRARQTTKEKEKG